MEIILTNGLTIRLDFVYYKGLLIPIRGNEHRKRVLPDARNTMLLIPIRGNEHKRKRGNQSPFYWLLIPIRGNENVIIKENLQDIFCC